MHVAHLSHWHFCEVASGPESATCVHIVTVQMFFHVLLFPRSLSLRRALSSGWQSELSLLPFLTHTTGPAVPSRPCYASIVLLYCFSFLDTLYVVFGMVDILLKFNIKNSLLCFYFPNAHVKNGWKNHTAWVPRSLMHTGKTSRCDTQWLIGASEVCGLLYFALKTPCTGWKEWLEWRTSCVQRTVHSSTQSHTFQHCHAAGLRPSAAPFPLAPLTKQSNIFAFADPLILSLMHSDVVLLFCVAFASDKENSPLCHVVFFRPRNSNHGGKDPLNQQLNTCIALTEPILVWVRGENL